MPFHAAEVVYSDGRNIQYWFRHLHNFIRPCIFEHLTFLQCVIFKINFFMIPLVHLDVKLWMAISVVKKLKKKWYWDDIYVIWSSFYCYRKNQCWIKSICLKFIFLKKVKKNKTNKKSRDSSFVYLSRSVITFYCECITHLIHRFPLF